MKSFAGRKAPIDFFLLASCRCFNFFMNPLCLPCCQAEAADAGTARRRLFQSFQPMQIFSSKGSLSIKRLGWLTKL
jgi:hypothetical protein